MYNYTAELQRYHTYRHNPKSMKDTYDMYSKMVDNINTAWDKNHVFTIENAIENLSGDTWIMLMVSDIIRHEMKLTEQIYKSPHSTNHDLFIVKEYHGINKIDQFDFITMFDSLLKTTDSNEPQSKNLS